MKFVCRAFSRPCLEAARELARRNDAQYIQVVLDII
jgi:hypothetical protein